MTRRTTTKAAGLTRREVLKGSSALGLSLLGVASGCEGAPPDEERPPPNVLLITADDLGWRDLTSYGSAIGATPALDRLAEEGVRFERAFDVASSCSSSRASFITGQYPHTHGVVGLAHVHTELSLPQGYRTLPSLLYAAGYETALEGKWHVAPFEPVEAYGYARFLNPLALPSYVIPSAAASVAFLEENRARPFYLELNFMHTHRGPGGDFEMASGFEVDPALFAVPAYWNLPDWDEIREEAARYFSQLQQMDAIVGEVLAALDALELSERTLVAFVSDNGPPFPGNKMTLYDRGTGTPLLLRWPGVLPAGARVSSLVSTLDLMPTLLDACGVAIPDDVEGRSLLPLARADGASTERSAIFAEMTFHKEHIPMRAVRTERFKYIRNYSDRPIGLDDVEDEEWAQRLVQEPDQPWTSPRVPEELYDLAADPNERVNLVATPSYAEELATLRELLDEHMRSTDDPLLGAPFEVTG